MPPEQEAITYPQCAANIRALQNEFLAELEKRIGKGRERDAELNGKVDALSQQMGGLIALVRERLDRAEVRLGKHSESIRRIDRRTIILAVTISVGTSVSITAIGLFLTFLKFVK